MDKFTFNEFRHLMSAMLFISDELDKDQEINDLYTEYKEQGNEDPVEWAREAFEDCGPDTHDMYIRPTFRARTYHEAQTSY